MLARWCVPLVRAVASQDLNISNFGDDLQFGGMEAEISAGDFGLEGPPLGMEGEFALGAGGEVPPSPALTGVGAEALEIGEEIFVARAKGKRPKKGPRAYVPTIDEQTEMSAEGGTHTNGATTLHIHADG